MIEAFLQQFSARVSLLLLCDPDVSEVERWDEFLRRAASFWYVLRLADGFPGPMIITSSFRLTLFTQRLIDARTYLSATEKRQLLVRSLKRRVNFLIITSQLPCVPRDVIHFRPFILHWKFILSMCKQTHLYSTRREISLWNIRMYETVSISRSFLFYL